MVTARQTIRLVRAAGTRYSGIECSAHGLKILCGTTVFDNPSASCGFEAAGEEIQNGLGENVVAIAGHHVPRAAHIGELDLREAR